MDQLIKEETAWIEERQRLFSTPDHALSHSDQYQKMRYLREIEGEEYIKFLKIGFTHNKAADKAIKNADEIVKNLKNCST